LDGFRLTERFTAREFDKIAGKGLDSFSNIPDAQLLPTFKSIAGIAVGAVQIAAAETDKNARQARVGGFPLQAVKDLGYGQHVKK